jgi:hypothetical protein
MCGLNHYEDSTPKRNINSPKKKHRFKVPSKCQNDNSITNKRNKLK